MTTLLPAETMSTKRTRPPRSLEVIWDPAPEDIAANVDWSDWYLTDEADMGESGEQYLIIRALLSYLTELARERAWQDTLIGADQFFAWIEQEPLVRVSPDVYLLDHPPPRPLPASWQTWLPGHHPPRLAFEIVSESNWRKDYRDAPAKYAQLGAKELIIFDPEAAAKRTTKFKERVALQVFRRNIDSGFIRVHSGSNPVRSEELDAWLVVYRESNTASLRIARDAKGKDLILSVEQALKKEQIAHKKEQIAHKKEQIAHKKEQIAREKEQIAREKAECSLAEALAELERLKNAHLR